MHFDRHFSLVLGCKQQKPLKKTNRVVPSRWEHKARKMLIIKRMNRCFDPRHSSDIWKSMSENIALKPSVSFSRAAVTNYHTFGGLKQQKFTHSWGSVKSEIKVPGGSHSLQSLEGRILSCIFQLLVAPYPPWLVNLSLQSLPLSSRCLLFFQRHRLLNLEPTPDQGFYLEILN